MKNASVENLESMRGEIFNSEGSVLEQNPKKNIDFGCKTRNPSFSPQWIGILDMRHLQGIDRGNNEDTIRGFFPNDLILSRGERDHIEGYHQRFQILRDLGEIHPFSIPSIVTDLSPEEMGEDMSLGIKGLKISQTAHLEPIVAPKVN